MLDRVREHCLFTSLCGSRLEAQGVSVQTIPVDCKRLRRVATASFCLSCHVTALETTALQRCTCYHATPHCRMYAAKRALKS